MKKNTIMALFILMSISIVGCSNNKVDPPPANTNQAQSSDQASPQENSPQSDNMTEKPEAIAESKEYISNLYKELEGKLIEQKEKYDKSSWDEFTREFNNKKSKAKDMVKDSYLNEAMINLENLYDEYDKAIKNGVEVSKDKITEMRNKIEEILKR